MNHQKIGQSPEPDAVTEITKISPMHSTKHQPNLHDVLEKELHKKQEHTDLLLAEMGTEQGIISPASERIITSVVRKSDLAGINEESSTLLVDGDKGSKDDNNSQHISRPVGVRQPNRERSFDRRDGENSAQDLDQNY